MAKKFLMKASTKASPKKISSRATNVVTPKMLNSITRKLIDLTIQIDKSKAQRSINNPEQDE